MLSVVEHHKRMLVAQHREHFVPGRDAGRRRTACASREAICAVSVSDAISTNANGSAKPRRQVPGDRNGQPRFPRAAGAGDSDEAMSKHLHGKPAERLLTTDQAGRLSRQPHDARFNRSRRRELLRAARDDGAGTAAPVHRSL